MVNHFFNKYISVDNKHALYPFFQVIQFYDIRILNKYWIKLDSLFISEWILEPAL